MSVLFLSHRGESEDAPENTLRAFALAMERRSDGIELDVRLTADKQVVCCHDETLSRVAGVSLAVAQSTLAELRCHHPVPLLAEAIELLRDDARMQIELKGSPEQIPFVSKILASFPHRERFVISSFEKETVAGAVSAFPDLPRVLLIDLEEEFGSFPKAAEVIDSLRPLRCGVSFKASFKADAAFVAELRNSGMMVVGWGVSNDELGMHLAKIGVDAMTNNHAVALREKYRKFLSASKNN